MADTGKPEKFELREGVPRRRMDYELPILLSNLGADIALFEESGDAYDLMDALRGIQKILMEITGESR